MDAIKAVVQNVIPQGRHGSFAIAASDKVEGSITFSLKEDVWQEQEWPEQGTIVVLSNLRKKRAGWRAMSGRFLRPSDEQPAFSKPERSRTMKVCSCCHYPEKIDEQNPFAAMMIPYLKSHPKDDSTLGYGNHTKRQARVLLKLFGEYVLGIREGKDEISFATGGEFAGSYGMTKEIDLEEPGLKSFDFEGLERIRKAIQQDQQKLAEMGLEPTSDDERVKQYCAKLYRSLEENLFQLASSTELTQTTYDVQDKGPESMQGIGLFMATFACRHHTDQTGAAVRNLYGVMVPILLVKLVEAGYTPTLRWK